MQILVDKIKPQFCKSVLMLKIISPQAYIKVYREAYIILNDLILSLQS
jgi:hypothetical protein